MSTLFAVPAEQRERVRLAIVELSQADEKVQVRTVQRRAKVATRFVTVLLRALRAGYLSLDLPWDGSTAPLDLEGAIRSASNHRDRTRIHQEVAARVAAGSLYPTVAKTIQDSLSAARLSSIGLASAQIGVRYGAMGEGWRTGGRLARSACTGRHSGLLF